MSMSMEHGARLIRHAAALAFLQGLSAKRDHRSACACPSMHRAFRGNESPCRLVQHAWQGTKCVTGQDSVHGTGPSLVPVPCIVHLAGPSLIACSCIVHGTAPNCLPARASVIGEGAILFPASCIVHFTGAMLFPGASTVPFTAQSPFRCPPDHAPCSFFNLHFSFFNFQLPPLLTPHS